MDFSEAIRTHKRFLEDRIDPDFRLLDKLYSCEIIDQRERATILSKNTFWERNSQLLDYILTKNQSGVLITAFRESDQKHIGNFITANGERSCEFGEDWPLEKAEISILKYNHEWLVDFLDLTNLLSLLYSSKVINNRQRDSISSKPTSHEKNEVLLEILRRRSLRDYRQTIICLRQSQQSHIAEILEKGGVVVRAHANLGDDVKNVTAAENEIVTTIADLLIDKSSDQRSRILGLVPKVIAAKTGQSIVLYIYCKTIGELQQLQESLDSGKLKDSVGLWFNSLLYRSQTISVKALTVSTEEFKKMQTYFKETRMTTEAIKKHRDFLEERMDPDCGLLDKLLDRRTIGWSELEDVKNKGSWYERNSQLLSYILSKDEGDALNEALREADQSHIANYVTENGSRPKDCNGEVTAEYEVDWPLTAKEISILDTNHGSLIDLLDLSNLTLDLYLSTVINMRQKDSISSKSTSQEKKEQLLGILRRCSIRDYRQAITCLHRSQQGHLATVLRDGGVVVKVHTNLGEDVENVTGTEIEIATKIEDFLIGTTSDAQIRILQLLHHRVIAVKRLQSVVLYIYCTTIYELQHLQESLTSGKLKDSVESWFNSLLNRSRRISVTALTVSTKEFQTMRAYFKETDHKSSQTTLNDLPLELIDAILEKSFLHWVLNYPSGQGDGDIIRALASVDFCWFQRVTKRRIKSRIWKRLKAFYDRTKKQATIIRSNRNFFLENIHLNQELMLSINCITEEQSHLMQRQPLRSKGDKRDKLMDVMNDKLLSVVKSLDETKYSNFLKCLRQANQKMVARILENGGGIIKVQVLYRVAKFMDIHKLHQSIEDFLNRTAPWSYECHKLITELKKKGIEILNSEMEKYTVVIWMWCRSQEAIENLRKLYESNKLRDMLFSFANSGSSAIEIIQSIFINIDSNQFKKIVVMSSISVNFIDRIDGGEAYGITKLQNEIYVVRRSEESDGLVIIVFEDRNPFHLKRKIEKQEIEVVGVDIGSSKKENCLYVSDHDKQCIWKLTRETEDEYKFVKWLTTDYRPYRLSVLRNGNLLLFDNSYCNLMIYGSDAELIRSIQLRSMVFIRHAVETSIGTLVILHRMREEIYNNWPMEKKRSDFVLSELTSDGQMVVRRFIPSNDEQILSDPQYLSLDSDDQVILVESYGYGRVTLFDPDLKWNGVLIPTKDNGTAKEGATKKPKRVCYDEENKQLIVGGDYEGGTNIYSYSPK